MKPSEVNRFLAKQSGESIRALSDHWEAKAATDPAFRKEWPNPSLFAAAQIESRQGTVGAGNHVTAQIANASHAAKEIASAMARKIR